MALNMSDREYDGLHAAHRARYRNRDFPLFSTWLDRRVDSMIADNQYVSPELRNLAVLPQSLVTEYRRMWAYGNHYRVESEAHGNTYVTYDSGIACVATALCQASSSDRRPVEAQLKYVGVLRNIKQVDYVYMKINVMECSWIKPNVAGNPTMRQDEHGFWLIRKGAFQSARSEPFLLPRHASQVSVYSWTC